MIRPFIMRSLSFPRLERFSVKWKSFCAHCRIKLKPRLDDGKLSNSLNIFEFPLKMWNAKEAQSFQKQRMRYAVSVKWKFSFLSIELPKILSDSLKASLFNWSFTGQIKLYCCSNAFPILVKAFLYSESFFVQYRQIHSIHTNVLMLLR